MGLNYDSFTRDNLVELVNNHLHDDFDIYFEDNDYVTSIFDIWNDPRRSLYEIKKTFKFKCIGNASDYSDIISANNTFYTDDMYSNYEDIDKIYVSEKYNAAMICTIQRYYLKVLCIVDKEYYPKFNKKLKPIIVTKSSGLFNSVDFKCKKNEYIEITNPKNDDDTIISIQKSKVKKDNIVFDEDSVLYKIMKDVKMFFHKETKELYKKMNISYRRGIILYGAPGNGKTSMIRELIRELHGITIIILNASVEKFTFVLSELLIALDGRKALIVMEDFDSIIEYANRSELLNILDGIDKKDGTYFIGTTNYIDRIDSGFVNRPGRFDKSYSVGNPSDTTRRLYFKESNIENVLSMYTLHEPNSSNSVLDIIDLFVLYSNGLSMANLKELIISTKYTLISNEHMSVEEALKINSEIILKNIQDAKKNDNQNNQYNDRYAYRRRYR